MNNIWFKFKSLSFYYQTENKLQTKELYSIRSIIIDLCMEPIQNFRFHAYPNEIGNKIESVI